MKDLLKAISLIAVIVFLSGCAANLASAPARITDRTAAYNDLVSLPPPENKIAMAVYKFKDQTGQYKDSSSFTNSTAVTQGATSMLVKTAGDSGWAILPEREGLNDLLTERKIIENTRNRYKKINNGKKEELPPLPPLIYASVILEGGIIAYETNLSTGGFGAKYFGIGGFTEVRRHQVTIYLRAISVKDGRVLHTVAVTKSIYSQAIDFSFYRFVLPKKLLEAETGVTANEPLQMCIAEAIEKAFHDLIIEGILAKDWNLKNLEDIKSPVILRYLEEREGKKQKVIFDKKGNLKKIVEEN